MDISEPSPHRPYYLFTYLRATDIRKPFERMDQMIPLEIQVHANDESSPLIHIESRLRTYQAYCVTEASSRAPSPDSSIPHLLRRRSSSPQQRNIEPRFLPDGPHTQSSLTSTEKDGSLAISPEREFESNGQQMITNPESSSHNTDLNNGDHITQAVNPRGSHPLVGNQTLLYDRTPSQLRLQRSVASYEATSRAYQRKPLPLIVGNAEVESHPLPPLPVEAPLSDDCEESGVKLGCVRTFEEDLKHILQNQQGSFRNCEKCESAGLFPTAGHSEEDQHLSLEVESGAKGRIKSSPRRKVEFQGGLPSRMIQVFTDNALFHDSNQSTGQGDVLFDHAQLSSSVDLFVSRSDLEEMNNDRHAQRRTQPKDAKLKYPFGRRPSLQLNLPPAIPLHRQSPTSANRPHSYNASSQQATDAYLALPPLSPSFHSSIDAHTGPRPPPWLSCDNLEMQRRNRGEAREREEIRKLRVTINTAFSGPLHIGCDSNYTFGESPMRREVEVFREQVLRLYPDMEFDSNSGKAVREHRCCCVVM